VPEFRLALEFQGGAWAYTEPFSVGILLRNLEPSGSTWTTSRPDWRVIVEAIIRLEVLPRDIAEKLHHELVDSGLSMEQCRTVARGLRNSVLADMQPDELLYMNGERLHESEVVLMELGCEYSTNADVLTGFVTFCESCDGFRI